MEAQTITVAAEHEYPVVIGRCITSRIDEFLPAPARLFIVHPPSLKSQVGKVCSHLRGLGREVHIFCTPDGEEAKTGSVLEAAWSAMARQSLTRDDVVVGIGGGATTDLAGFIAATFLRGIRFLNVPTTLLGMVDAAVGGKTGINIAEGKNLVGAFYSPQAVICDLDWLATLPEADLRAGMAEVIKCGFIADPQILELIEADPVDALESNSARLAELIVRAISVKAQVVSADLKEAGYRENLNYGHTFAHAIEQFEHFGLRHGEAVAIGLNYVATLANMVGKTSDELLARHRRILEAVGLDTGYQAGHWQELRTVMGRDKKARGHTLRFVVLEGLAAPVRLEGPAEELLEDAYRAITGER